MSEGEGNKKIYCMHADGKNPSKLAENLAFDGSAYWFEPAMEVGVNK